MDKAKALGELLATQRTERGYSIRQLAAKAEIDKSTLARLEQAKLLAPQTHTLRALAQALEMPVSDVFTAAGWLSKDELPSFRPYMRAKFKDLDEDAIEDLVRYAERLSKRASIGPIDHEDE
jgi:transcriptional regulator with XRE-family HTH domain